MNKGDISDPVKTEDGYTSLTCATCAPARRGASTRSSPSWRRNTRRPRTRPRVHRQGRQADRPHLPGSVLARDGREGSEPHGAEDRALRAERRHRHRGEPERDQGRVLGHGARAEATIPIRSRSGRTTSSSCASPSASPRRRCRSMRSRSSCARASKPSAHRSRRRRAPTSSSPISTAANRSTRSPRRTRSRSRRSRASAAKRSTSTARSSAPRSRCRARRPTSPRVSSVPLTNDTYALLQLDSVTDGDPSKLDAKTKEAARNTLAGAVAQTTAREFVDALRANATVRVSAEKLESQQ